MAEETVVIDSAAPVSDSAPVDSAPVSTPDTSIPDATGTTDPISSDPNDPMAALEAAMADSLPKDEPEPAADGQIPEQFQQALGISDFVKDAQGLTRAVQAADEVWKVATGQMPARALFEALRNSNPAQSQAIENDLRAYLGVGQQANPLADLQQANPQAFQEIANYYQQVTGKAIDGSQDPHAQRLAELEGRIAAEDNRRATEAWNQQVTTARTKAMDFLASKTKGTFAEGQDAYLFARCAEKVQIPQEEMVSLLLQGKTDKLESAYRQVLKEETGRLKEYNKNLVANYRKQKSMVPAPGTGAKQVKGDATAEALKPLPGETAAAHAARLWNNKLV